jgi:hypothetical protein
VVSCSVLGAGQRIGPRRAESASGARN